MHSGFEIPGIQLQQPPETNCSPLLLSMNQTHILEQIHTLPATQQLFLDQHGHFLHQTRPSHHYVGGGGAASPPYFPVNFKLGLNEICTRNHEYKNEGAEDGLIRGSEQYEVEPEARDNSLGMLHSWQNQQDSAIKQQPFWEPLPAEVSNENSEIVDRQDNLEMNQQKEAPTTCLDTKNRVHFSELEAIYKRLGTTHHHQSNQTGPNEILPVPVGFDNGSDASIGEEVKKAGKKRKKKQKKKENSYNETFFGDLVKQVMDHQENLHKRFTQVIEKLDGERRAREDAWRSQELARFEREAKARALDKALAESREAMIVSYLEKITGQRINLPTLINPTEIASTNSSDAQDDYGPRKGCCLG